MGAVALVDAFRDDIDRVFSFDGEGSRIRSGPGYRDAVVVDEAITDQAEAMEW